MIAAYPIDGTDHELKFGSAAVEGFMVDAPSPIRGFGLPIAVWIMGMLTVVFVLWSVLSERGEASSEVRMTNSSIRALIERGATTMPGPGSGGYHAPTAAERADLATAVGDIESGDLERAASRVGPLGYTVERVTDSETDQEFVVVRAEDGATAASWGTFIYAPEAASGLIIEVPHPRADMFTEHLGAETILRSGARWVLVAGANRDATEDADVAHESESAFEAVHRQVLISDGAGPVIQLHGFDGASRDYGDAVVSSGTSEPTKLVRRLADALTALGISTCVHDDDHCSELGGTTNVQGVSAREAGVAFVHLELSQPLRADAAMRIAIADAITETLRSPA